MSKYDPENFEKRERPREAKPREQYDRGCGDPRCHMCYPQNYQGSQFIGPAQGVQESGMALSNFGSSPSADMIRYTREMMEREGRSIPDGVFGKPANNLKALREPIADLILTTPHDLSWDSVIGNDTARYALMETVEAATKHKEIYDFYGMKPAKGAVLWGPPGCGKTMFGKVVAARLAAIHSKAVEMILINGQSIESPFIGQTEKKIANIFSYAREYRKIHGHQLVIFIDEADALLPSRASAMRWQISTISAFLAEMDGLEANGAFVLLATNRPEALDEALMRDGRCDRKIKVERPGLEEAIKLLHIGITDLPIPDIHVDTLAWAVKIADYIVSPKHIVGKPTAVNLITEERREVHLTLAHIMNGAMLVSVANRAKAFAFRRDIAEGVARGIVFADLIAAVDEIVSENKGMSHDFALREMMEAMSKTEKVEMKRRMN